MTFTVAHARVLALLNVAGLTTYFPNGPKVIVQGASVAKDDLPGLFLVLPFDMSRQDPGTPLSRNSVRSYGFTIVALFAQAQDNQSANAGVIEAAVDALIGALEGQLLQASNSNKALGIERVKVREAGVANVLDTDKSFLQFVLNCTGEIYETP